MQDEKNLLIEEQYLEDANQSEYPSLIDNIEDKEPIYTISCNVGNVLNAISACFKSKTKDLYNKNIILINTNRKNNTLFFVRHSDSDLKITEIPFMHSGDVFSEVEIVYGVSDDFISSLEKRLSLESDDSKVEFRFYDDRIVFVINQSYYEGTITREEASYEDYVNLYEETEYVYIPVRFDILDNFIKSLNTEKDFKVTFLTDYVVINVKNDILSIYGGSQYFISKIDIKLEDSDVYNNVLMLFKKSILSDIVNYDNCKLMYNKEKNLTKVIYSKDNFIFTGYYVNVSLDGTVNKVVQIADDESEEGELVFEITSDYYNILDFVSKLDKGTRGNIFDITKHSDTSIQVTIKGIYGSSILFKERILSIVKKDFTITTYKNVIESISKVMKNMKNAVLSFYMRNNSMVIIKSHAGFDGYDFKSVFMIVKL